MKSGFKSEDFSRLCGELKQNISIIGIFHIKKPLKWLRTALLGKCYPFEKGKWGPAYQGGLEILE